MRSGFFNSEITSWDASGLPEFDRAESADFFAEFFLTFFKNGVFNDPANSLQVQENTSGGMTVMVRPGKALINGYFAWEGDVRTLQFQASEAQDRIDRVVLRLNLATRTIDLAVSKGVAATLPTPPDLNRPASGQSGDLYELGLANVLITKNSSVITQSKITDTRLQEEVCGVSIYAYDNPDLTVVFNQYQAALTEYMDVVRAALSDTLYGQLQNMIDAVEDKVNSPIENKTLLASSWSGATAPFSYNLVVSGVTVDSNQEIIPALNITPTELEALQGANLQDGGQTTDTVYIKAFGDKPTIDIPIRVLKRGVK